MNARFNMLLIIFMVFTISLYAQQSDKVINDIGNAVKKADASGIAAKFNTTVDLDIGNIDGNYSKKQAEVIVKDFFERNPVKSFSVNHQGSSNDGSIYIIGTYHSKNSKVYRVYILLKKTGNDLLIHQLQFDAD